MTYYEGPEKAAYEALGRALKQAREDMGVSGCAVERELELSNGVVSMMERGRLRSRVLRLVVLADYYGASLDDLTRDMMLPAEGDS